jgi:hypothetical protein
MLCVELHEDQILQKFPRPYKRLSWPALGDVQSTIFTSYIDNPLYFNLKC